MSMIKLDQVSKIYNNDGVTAIGIQNVSLEFNLGEFVAITGESGSGKSTLLNVVSMMDSYEEGELFIDDKSTVDFSRKDFADYRANYVSFIFQEYNLVDSFTVLDNVMLPLLSRGYPRKEAKRIALESIEKVGLTKVRNHKATHLSGGEKQRTVIARALVSNTPIIACDEPTGNLDSETAVQVIELLKEISPGKLILYVTHDYSSIEHVATRHIQMNDSHVQSDTLLEKEPTPAVFENTNKAKTKFGTVLATGLKDVVSTPKKSFLSLLIAFVISLSSVGILTGAFSLIEPATQHITTVENTYADKMHFHNNKVMAYGKGDNDTELSSIDFGNDIVVDYGSVLSSHQYYTINGSGGTSMPQFECYEVNLIKDTYELLPKLGTAPVEKNEFALGISKEKFDSYVTDRYAIQDLTRRFLDMNTFTVIPLLCKSSIRDYKIKPTGVYLVDDLNNADYTMVFSNEGLKEFRSKILSTYVNSNNYNTGFSDPHTSEAIFTINGSYVKFIENGYTFLRPDVQSETPEYRKIYISEKYQGFDVEMTLRGAHIVISKDDSRIVYSDKNFDGIYIHQAMFTTLLAESKQVASYYAPSEKAANGVLSSLLSHSIMAYRSDTPQSSLVSIHEEGYQNMLLIIAYIVTFVGSSILIAFLGSLILGAIYNSRKKDYAILLSLSFSPRVVRFINMVEMYVFFIITSLVSYLTFLITSGIVGHNLYMASLDSELYAATLEGFGNIFNSMYSFLSSPLFIVIYFVFNALFAFLVSTWIMNKFMTKTLANNLRKGGELL